MKKLLIILTFILMSFTSFAQPAPGGGDCATASPICTDYAYDFPLQTGTVAETGPDYGCLISQPSPVWYYFEISTSGDIIMDLEGEIDPIWGGYYDVDFIIWGPFTNVTCNYSDLSSVNIVDCSFSASGQETPEIGPGSSGGSTTAIAGEVYMMMITNYADVVQNVTFSQSGGGGSTDCSIVNPECTVDAGPDQEICLGDFTNTQATATVINSVGSYSFVWTPLGTYVNDSTQTIQANAATQTYTVTLTTDDGCVATDDVTITTVELLIDQIVVTDENCGFSDGTATITMQNGTSPYTYDIGTQSNSTGVFTGLVANIYDVTVTDINGCTVTGQFTILDPGTINADFYPNVNGMCLSVNNFNFNNNGFSDPNSTYLWDFGGSQTVNGISSNSSTLENPTNVYYNNPGIYQVELEVTYGSCLDNITYDIEVYANVTLSFTQTDLLCYDDCDATATVTPTGLPPYTFNWSNTNIGPTATNLCSGTHDVVVVDANGCIESGSITIVDPPQMNINLISTENVSCYNFSDGSIEVSANGGTPPYTYDNGFTNQLNGTFINLQDNVYDISISDANGCEEIISNIQITEPTELMSTVVTTDVLCNGDSIGSYVITTVGGNPPYQYFENGVPSSSSSIFLTVGTYNISVVDDNNCVEILTANINEPNELVSSIQGVYNICNGTSVDLIPSTTGGISPYTYQWNTGDITDVITVNPSDTTTYTYFVYDYNGCEFGPVHTQVKPTIPIILNLFPQETLVCPGNSTLLNYTIQNGLPPYTVHVNNSIIGTNPVTVYPSIGSTFDVKVTDGCGQVTHEFVNLSTYDVPDISFQSDVLSGCEPLTVHFQELNNLNLTHTQYKWDFGDGTIGFGPNTEIIYKNNGTYTVSLSVTTNEGCLSTSTIQNMIIVYPLPQASYHMNPYSTDVLHSTIEFINISDGGTYYIWDFGDNDSSSVQHPIHTYETAGIFNTSLKVITNHNCVDSVMNQILISDITTFFAPTAFSPDGDNINEGWSVIGYNINRDNFYLAVYDRWGEIIWKTNDYDEKWKGTVKFNEYVQNGTYVWFCSWLDFDDVRHEKSGIINVLR